MFHHFNMTKSKQCFFSAVFHIIQNSIFFLNLESIERRNFYKFSLMRNKRVIILKHKKKNCLKAKGKTIGRYKLLLA